MSDINDREVLRKALIRSSEIIAVRDDCREVGRKEFHRGQSELMDSFCRAINEMLDGKFTKRWGLLEPWKSTHDRLKKRLKGSVEAPQTVKECAARWLEDSAPDELVRGGEAVGWIRPSIENGDGWKFTANKELAEAWSRQGKKVTPVYTHPQPAQQGVPEWLYDGYAVYQNLTDEQKTQTSAKNVSDTLDAIVTMLNRPQPPAGQEGYGDE